MMVGRERASERCLAAWRRGSPPCTMVNVCQPHVLHVRSQPCHRARGEARRRQQDRRQAHGDPDCPVRFGTHDGRVAHSAHQRRLHPVRFGTHDGRVAHSTHPRKLFSNHAIFAWVAEILQSTSWSGFHCIREGDCSGFHIETLLLGMDYDKVLTTAVVHKEKANELMDNIFIVGIKRLRFGPCQPSSCDTSGCVSLAAACARWQCGVSSFMACGLGQAL